MKPGMVTPPLVMLRSLAAKSFGGDVGKVMSGGHQWQPAQMGRVAHTALAIASQTITALPPNIQIFRLSGTVSGIALLGQQTLRLAQIERSGGSVPKATTGKRRLGKEPGDRDAHSALETGLDWTTTLSLETRPCQRSGIQLEISRYPPRM